MKGYVSYVLVAILCTLYIVLPAFKKIKVYMHKTTFVEIVHVNVAGKVVSSANDKITPPRDFIYVIDIHQVQ